MDHIAHLGNQFKSINTFPKSYDNIIQLIWRVKTHHLLFNNWKVLHPRMFGAKFGWNWPSGSWEKDFFNFVKKYFCNFVIEKALALHLNKLEFPLLKNDLCQVWLKLAWWFWRRRWKCEKFTEQQTGDGQQATRIAKIELSAQVT